MARDCCSVVDSFAVLVGEQIGFLIGSTAVMTCLNLNTAIYWGQLSRCESHSGLSGYTCSNRTAYGFLSFFSVLLFLVQLGFTALLVMWRGDLINETGLYDDISAAPAGGLGDGLPYAMPASAAGAKTAPSADL